MEPFPRTGFPHAGVLMYHVMLWNQYMQAGWTLSAEFEDWTIEWVLGRARYPTADSGKAA